MAASDGESGGDGVVTTLVVSVLRARVVGVAAWLTMLTAAGLDERCEGKGNSIDGAILVTMMLYRGIVGGCRWFAAARKRRL